MHELYTVLAEYYDTIYKSRAERVKEEIDFVEEIFRGGREERGKARSRPSLRDWNPNARTCREGGLRNPRSRPARGDVEGCEAEGRGSGFERQVHPGGQRLDISFEEEFDAVTMFFSSIMYFDDSAIRELFNSVRRTLRPGGGVFIADFPCWFYGGNDGPIVWDERRGGDERLVITDWREVEPAVQKLRFKRLVQIIMPNGETKAFFVDDELNIYTPREMRLLAEQYFSEVKIYGNLRRDIAPPATGGTGWWP